MGTLKKGENLMNTWNNVYQFELEVANLENYQIYDWKWEISTSRVKSFDAG